MVNATVNATQKLTYQSPSITKVGEFETLTQHSGTGTKLDSTFPAGTPFTSLTLS